MDTIDVKDALALEEHQTMILLNNRTRHAIGQSYNTKSPTKKKRKLPGKRSWKNKKKYYASTQGQMTVKEFNSKKNIDEILERVYKKEQEKAIKAHAKKVQKRQKHALHD